MAVGPVIAFAVLQADPTWQPQKSLGAIGALDLPRARSTAVGRPRRRRGHVPALGVLKRAPVERFVSLIQQPCSWVGPLIRLKFLSAARAGNMNWYASVLTGPVDQLWRG
jgi:hypothetical protein